MWYFNPRSPCGERLRNFKKLFHDYVISIHAPRVGSDHCYRFLCGANFGFQSTLPVWERPAVLPQRIAQSHNFNPRSPCGERQHPRGTDTSAAAFQSTLPVWGATPQAGCAALSHTTFQSTLPVWGATVHFFDLLVSQGISIHAPRVGSDPRHWEDDFRPFYFNPRSPCGERQQDPSDLAVLSLFQSTLPVWGATSCSACYSPGAADFNPRSPCGERQQKCLKIFLRKAHNFVCCTKPKMFASAYRPSRQIFYGIFPKIRCEPP